MRSNVLGGSGDEILSDRRTDSETTDEGPQPPRQCKYCYSSDDDGRWMTPCRCTGSIGYVHSTCFTHWLRVAPFKQQYQCTACNHYYKKNWGLKHIRDWCLPRMEMKFWDAVEVLLDCYSTFKLIHGFFHIVNGRRSVLGQVAYFIFWKTFVLTEQRSNFYRGMMRAFAQTICDEIVEDVDID